MTAYGDFLLSVDIARERSPQVLGGHRAGRARRARLNAASSRRSAGCQRAWRTWRSRMRELNDVETARPPRSLSSDGWRVRQAVGQEADSDEEERAEDMSRSMAHRWRGPWPPQIHRELSDWMVLIQVSE